MAQKKKVKKVIKKKVVRNPAKANLSLDGEGYPEIRVYTVHGKHMVNIADVKTLLVYKKEIATCLELAKNLPILPDVDPRTAITTFLEKNLRIKEDDWFPRKAKVPHARYPNKKQSY